MKNSRSSERFCEQPVVARRVRETNAVILLAALGSLMLCAAVACVPGRAAREGKEPHRSWSGIDLRDETRVDSVPSAAAVPGFDSERVWSGFDDWEPAIAVDPSSNWVYQATTRFTLQRQIIMLRASSDGGATWGPDIPAPQLSIGQADPQVECDANGNVYIAYLEGLSTTFLKSDDHLATFSAPIQLPLGTAPYTDHPFVVVAASGQDIYIGFNAFHSYVSASHDGGASFLLPVRTDADNRLYFHCGGVIAPDGTIYFTTVDYSSNYLGNSFVKVWKSIDQGVSWTVAPVQTSRQAPTCTWAPGCYTGFLGPTSGLAVDSAGTLAVVCNAGNTSGGVERIILRTSTDGVTWSARRFVSAVSQTSTYAFPIVSTGAAPGDFRVVFQGGTANAWNTWYRRTTNGGVSFQPLVKVSDLTTGAPYKSAAGYNFPYGDYMEMATFPSGLNVFIWGEGTSYNGPGGSWYARGQ